MPALLPILMLSAVLQVPGSVIDGVVARSDSLEGIAEAQVTLWTDAVAPPAAEAITDVSGKFEFRNVQPGEYRISASRAGFTSGQFGKHSPYGAPALLRVTGNERLAGLVVRVFPTAAIAGRITSVQAGMPVSRAGVELLKADYDAEGLRGLDVVNVAYTDADGNYRFSSVPPDRYEIATEAATLDGELYAPLYYPASAAEDGAREIDLAPGENLEHIDVALSLSRSGSIRGQLVDGLFRRIPHMDWISLTPRTEGSPTGFRKRQMNQSTFEVPNVAPGSYYLSYYRFDDEQRATAAVRVDVRDGDVEDVVVVSGAACDITGRFRADGFSLNAGTIKIAFRPLDDPTSIIATSWYVDPFGNLQTLAMGCDPHRFSVEKIPPGVYVKSARLGNVDVLKDGLSFPATTKVLDVVLAKAAGAVAGLVVDGRAKPVESSHVVLVPRVSGLSRPDLTKAVNTDQLGRFEITGVAPGEYDLYAWEEMPQHLYYDPDFVKLFAGLGRQVVVASKGSVTTQVAIIPALTPSTR